MFVKESKSGQKFYTGLCIDLLDKLQEEMKFRYTIQESPGNVYGAPNVFTGEWNGMVRYLIDNVRLAFSLVVYYNLSINIGGSIPERTCFERGYY